ncbi:MAG: signal peptidase I [Eubacteriales bacterium]
MKKILTVTAFIGKTLLYTLLTVVLVFNLYGAVRLSFFDDKLPLFLGFGQAVVASGSMEPALSVDDWLLVHRQRQYDVDDIITYQRGSETPTTHRIIALTESGDFVTRGDANNTSDDPVPADAVKGKVILVVPKVGGLTRKPVFWVVMVGILGIYFLFPSRSKGESAHEEDTRE